jgi:hypothetical protein
MVFAGNKFTDWGNDHENEARELFESMMGYQVTEVGFVTRDDKIIGCSPDGLIMDEELISILSISWRECYQRNTSFKSIGAWPSPALRHGGL